MTRTINVGPDVERPTHHLRLYDTLSNELGLVLVNDQGEPLDTALLRSSNPRNPLKIYQGSSEYSDREPPWSSEGQTNWSSGRGNLRLSKNNDRFADAYRAITQRNNEIINGGQVVYEEGASGMYKCWHRHDGSGEAITYKHNAFTATKLKYAIKYTSTSTTSMQNIVFHAMFDWISQVPFLSVKIYSDSGGSPNASIGTLGTVGGAVGVGDVDAVRGEWHEYALTASSAISQSASTDYWIVFEVSEFPTGGTLKILGYSNVSGYTIKSYNGAWSEDGYPIMYRLSDAEKHARVFYQELKGTLYKIVSYEDGTSPVKIYMNGFQGIASGGSATTLEDDTRGGKAAWITDEWKGSIVTFRTEAPSKQKRPYRLITGNDGDTLNFNQPGSAQGPADGTEYSIIAADKWTEITGHNIANGTIITDFLEVGNILYIARYGGNMKRMEVYSNAGTWTWKFSDESDPADLLVTNTGWDKVLVWKSDNEASTVSAAQAKDGTGGAATSLDFSPTPTIAEDLLIGSKGDPITGLGIMGENTENVAVYKKSGLIYQVWYNSEAAKYTASKLPLNELKTQRDSRNGVAHAKSGPYSYHSMHNSVMRYYGSKLDSVGPNRDEGMPEGRTGPVTEMIPYAEDSLIMLVDGGEENYSSILFYNGGYHEIYRFPIKNVVCQDLAVQAIDGDACDRLWFSINDNSMWIPIAIDPYKHTQVDWNFYPFNHYSHIITSRIDQGMFATEKYFDAIKINVTPGHTINIITNDPTAVRVSKYTKEEGIGIPEYGPVSGSYEFEYVGGGYQDPTEITLDESGTFIQLRIELLTNSNRKATRVYSYLVDMIEREPHKSTFTISFRLMDQDRGLGRWNDTLTRAQKYSLIETWASDSSPISVDCVSELLHGKTLFLNPPDVRPKSIDMDGSEKEIWVCKAVLVEK